MVGLFHDRLDEVGKMLASPRAAQLQRARGIQNSVRHNIFEPWKGLFQSARPNA